MAFCCLANGSPTLNASVTLTMYHSVVQIIPPSLTQQDVRYNVIFALLSAMIRENAWAGSRKFFFPRGSNLDVFFGVILEGREDPNKYHYK